ncbi:caltractin (centrin), putative [Eimeria mitis]|uniref:Caltractin (Centrin), putative n=1 Tax=Eimeria mitis TaxID=44415 RepID=U6JR18_9EIME|nr:caltractin (centrin), putative [Eimeria mitis]CDJ27301.1 caltractin (centrin), putative [Eimeria mitis]
MAMRTLFEACDTDGTGTIPLKELKNRLVAAGFDVKGSALAEIVNIIDSSGRRVVTFSEFMQLVTPSSDLSSPEEVLKTFKQMDSDGSGRISVRHICRALKSSDLSSPEEVLKTFKQMDSDGSGRISVRHICRALKEANMTSTIAQELLSQADADNDGCILLQELQEVFSKQTYP